MELHNRTLGQWLEHWAETTPDKEYIVYSDRDLRFTWSEFNKRVDDMAKGMLRSVSLMARNHTIFRHANYRCLSADKIKMPVRKYFCFNHSGL